MSSDEWQYISCFDGFKVLQIPFKRLSISSTHRLSMSIILPDDRDGLDDLIKKVSSDPDYFLKTHLSLVSPLRVPVGEFRIPKFKVISDLRLFGALEDLGLDLPFNDNQEVIKMMTTGAGTEFEIYVDQVIQECVLEVDEVGTVAASSTAMVMDDTSALCSDRDDRPVLVDFVANHPFLFVIRDDLSGIVILSGNVFNPLLQDERDVLDCLGAKRST
ncbi:serpin-ZX-like [Papaver somniferum]|uniref:serpin-ZX-like n=1 Tax=Papaver somniferum TaxID=3469 RepID=UPI000E6F70BF|nr:serpin-ZX-like [Papaver somniferum]